ncbi:hypothetical protein SARC_03895 [Sphaeroforma arctica JP610]|uniref:Uncharacterized protein n=1 Tax=Sphaeroforma arctica JP610 TaxID=667725 RepID=A0A0L0G489_9EUKA|nr:hypothetical protein SARC_03895 [Sphaeroforma arctica JP610]KNC83870.1 hypothetical protein SARC_03895 [Sphaeroforma arctica JP610]|eukprot:XP_014157772.1 hypothetical protein SARC_03895 [Sphaeroforma arctica JP610]
MDPILNTDRTDNVLYYDATLKEIVYGAPLNEATDGTSCSSCTPLDVLNNQCGHGVEIVPSAKVACIGGNYGNSGSSSSDLSASYLSSGAEVAKANTVLGAIALVHVMAAMAMF